jgi:hypothetical protein
MSCDRDVKRPADENRPSAGRDQCALELESLIPAGQKNLDLPTGFPDREADKERGTPGNANSGNGLRR